MGSNEKKMVTDTLESLSKSSSSKKNYEIISRIFDLQRQVEIINESIEDLKTQLGEA